MSGRRPADRFDPARVPRGPRHPLAGRERAAPASSPADAAGADDAAAGVAPRERPPITLAQFLKLRDLAGSGGEAKARVRAGGVLVNGVEELRPGRKLAPGDLVAVDGGEHRVER